MEACTFEYADLPEECRVNFCGWIRPGEMNVVLNEKNVCAMVTLDNEWEGEYW